MTRLGLVLAGVLAGGGVLVAQQISGLDVQPKAPGYVLYKAEPQVVKAGKPARTARRSARRAAADAAPR